MGVRLRTIRGGRIGTELRLFRKDSELFLISLPAIVAFFFVAYLPMFGLVIAFKNYSYDKGILGSPWAGLENFKFFFTSQDALRVTRNTLLLNGSFILLGTAAALVLAVMLGEVSKRAVRIYQTVLFVPYFLSWVVVGYLTYGFLNRDLGVANSILRALGVTPIDWYSDRVYWPAILIMTYIWKSAGYLAIIFYTGILGIDSTLYEAASIDGASRVAQIWYVTLPSIKTLIIMMLILSIGKIFYSDFGLFYFIPRDIGTLYPTTDVIDTYVYRSLRVLGDLGMASAAGFYQSIVGFVLVLGSNLIVRKTSPESALF
jgi:putative aldouronate transport system permease protein